MLLNKIRIIKYGRSYTASVIFLQMQIIIR